MLKRCLEGHGIFIPASTCILGTALTWVEDADQNIYGKEPVSLPGFVGYRADTNFRSPESIATFVRDVLPFRFEVGNDLPGLGVGVHAYDDPEDQLRIVSQLVVSPTSACAVKGASF